MVKIKSTNSRTRNQNIDTILGANIRSFRLQACITQGELSEKIGITFQQIQKYEKGTNRVSCSTLFEIAKALNISFEDFLQGTKSNSLSDKNILPAPTNWDEQKLLDDYRSLSKNNKQLVRRMIRMMTEAMAA